MEQSHDVCIIPKEEKKGIVHVVLSHSYFMYMFAIIFGLILDRVFGLQFSPINYSYTGAIVIVLGSIIVYWAQLTSRRTKKEALIDKNKKRDFARGPYKYSRNPTHVGLSLLVLGLGIIMGSLFTIILMIGTFILTKTVFLRQEERILEEKYGQDYCEYKEKVRTWL